jgi:hypothetical protein
MKYFCSLLLASTVAFSMEPMKETPDSFTRYRFSWGVKNKPIKDSLETAFINALPMPPQNFKVWLEEKISTAGGRNSAQSDQLIRKLNLIALEITARGNENDLANRDYLSSLLDTEAKPDLTQVPPAQEKEQSKRRSLAEVYQTVTHRRQVLEESLDESGQLMQSSIFGAMEASDSGNRLAQLEKELENNRQALGLRNQHGNRLLELKKENERKAYLLKLQREIEKEKRDKKLKEYQMAERKAPPKLDVLINRMAQVHLSQSGVDETSLEDSSFGEESLTESRYD